MIRIPCKRLSPTAMIPMKMHESDSAFDLLANDSKVLGPNEVAAISTGIALELPPDLCALVLSRSGLAVKHKVFVLNAPGLIDSGYRGDIQVVLYNAGDSNHPVLNGDRIAQLMFNRVENIMLGETTATLAETDRGAYGLGSTGITFLGDDDFSAPI